MPTLFDDFLKQAIPPEEYVPLEGTILFKTSDNNDIVLEIFQRKDGSFGFRYQAWVGWRDAGNNLVSHRWTEINPGQTTITDELVTVKNAAIEMANSKGLVFKLDWEGA